MTSNPITTEVSTWRFSGDLDWMRRAACVGMNGDLFFERSTERRRSDLPCTSCPVRVECYNTAVSNREAWHLGRRTAWTPASQRVTC